MNAENHSLELAELDKQKPLFSEYVARASHTADADSEPAEDESREQPHNRNLEVATKNSRRLWRLVNQLLDFQNSKQANKS